MEDLNHETWWELSLMLASLIRSFFLLLAGDFRNRYPSTLIILGEFIGIATSLTIYWYTSLAFGKSDLKIHISGLAPDYFSFVVLGEVSLAIPVFIISGTLTQLQKAQADATLEAFFLLPWPRNFVPLALQLPQMLIEFSRALLTFFLAAVFFQFHISIWQLLAWITVQLAGIPTFVGLGYIVTGFYLKYGRGQGAAAVLMTVGTLLGGVYFPTTLLPETVQKVASAFIPFNLFIDGIRSLFLNGWTSAITDVFTGLCFWGIMAVSLGWTIMSIGIRSVYKRGCIDVHK